jgi:hypothetical protein
MLTPYEKYYAAKLEGALIFQDFVIDAAWTILGLAIVQYGSKAYQQAIGESRTGVEIKFDQKFGQTGNLWIEIAERAHPRNGAYAPSGIYRTDNTWLYCIGDYDTIFFFAKNLLRGLHRSGRWPVCENQTATSEGFLLRKPDAEKFADVILRPKAKKKIERVVGDLADLGRRLHEIAKANPAQGSLFNFADDADA